MNKRKSVMLLVGLEGLCLVITMATGYAISDMAAAAAGGLLGLAGLALLMRYFIRPVNDSRWTVELPAGETKRVCVDPAVFIRTDRQDVLVRMPEIAVSSDLYPRQSGARLLSAAAALTCSLGDDRIPQMLQELGINREAPAQMYPAAEQNLVPEGMQGCTVQDGETRRVFVLGRGAQLTACCSRILTG